ncbi:MAG: fused MFS/spermidine synthase [Candidatus Sumerlaeia bacterium]|nr:fused MFS/spermidine synthase [Candidatus Sumerlaeia bacterium]
MSDASNAPAPPRLGLARGVLVALMFFFSGATALVYEVVWTRQLTTVFGATVYAVATVLTAFMGGLALGSWLIGKRADRLRRPLMVFGLLEIGIALGSLAFPFLLRATTPIVGAFYATGGEGTFFVFSLLRFVIAFALLMVPTTLMGATLPVMSRAVTYDLRAVGRGVGGLYALNTAGAVLGVFATGFFLLEHFGVWRSTLLAASADIAIGIGAILLGWSLRVPTGEELEQTVRAKLLPPLAQPVGISPRVARIVMGTYFFSGFVALCYQVAWTRSLLFGFETLKATTYSFAGMLTVFLLGLAIGSAIMQAVVDRIRDLLMAYGAIQLLLAISGALTPFLIRADMPLFFVELADDNSGALNYWGAIGNVMLRTALVIGLPTLLMGMAFPVVARIVVGSLGHLGRDVGGVYALNTCGAIAGAFLGGFVLIPTIGITPTIGVLASITFAIVLVVMGLHPAVPRGRRPVLAVAFVLVAGIFVFRVAGDPSRYPFHALTVGERLIAYDEGSLATVSVIEDSKGWRTIYVDAVGVAGTDPVLQTDQKSLAHVPMVLLGGRAESVLTVGFGSGGASYSYTLYPEVRNIHAIEITSTVPKAAPTLTDANHGIVYPRREIERLRAAGHPADAPIPGIGRSAPSARPLADYVHPVALDMLTFDPRYRLIIDDARSYLHFTDTVYDVIATDCTDLRYKSNANLYDLEYFELCRRRISDRGLVVVWVPLAGLSDEAFRIVVRTFRAVFPDMTVWYFANQPTHYCLFIGQKGGLRISYADVLAALENNAILDDLDEIGLREPAKIVSSFVTDQRGIDTYIGDGPLNTEDFPIIEFLSPRYGYDSRPIAENMGRLYDVQVPVWDLIVDPHHEAAHADRARIAAYQQANDILFQGHAEYRLFNFVEACRHYLAALAIAPEDESIQRLLEFDELRLLLDAELERGVHMADHQWLNAQWIAHQLGLVFLAQGRHSDAVTTVTPFLRRMPPPSAPQVTPTIRDIGRALNLLLADCYTAAGNNARAEEFRRAAEQWRAVE